MRVHCCLFDGDCLRDARRYGMPLRLHVGKKSITLFANNRKSRKIWATGKVYKRNPKTNVWSIRNNETGEWTETDPPLSWRKATGR